AIRQKKEADDKARAERKEKAEKEKAERNAAAKDGDIDPPQENGGDEPAGEGEEQAPKAAYEILRRSEEETEENGAEEEADAEAVDAPANGTIVDDKAVKPKEVVRDPPTGPRGSWRRPSKPNNDAAAAGSGPTAEKLEDDGWSTVPAKGKNQSSRGRGRGRGGNQGARAIAS
ncbi:MAG: hypothetical protein INR71_05615, partial [Terriglobus roseus]|nr:hypothetical protein [Terriglobus roseus]